MGLLKDLGDWLEQVSNASIVYTWENRTEDDITWSDADSRTLDRAINISQVARVLNGKAAKEDNE